MHPSSFGAADRNRTGTDFTPRDFKSLVSTYSTTAAYLLSDLVFTCWEISVLCLPIPPFGVPDIFLADGAAASAIDPGTRCALAYSATGGARARGHSGKC